MVAGTGQSSGRNAIPSPHRDIGLALVGPGAGRIGLLRGVLQGVEDDLREAFADGELHRLRGGVEPAQGERPLEARVDGPEGTDEAAPGPGRPDPQRPDQPGPELEVLLRADEEPGPRRET